MKQAIYLSSSAAFALLAVVLSNTLLARAQMTPSTCIADSCAQVPYDDTSSTTVPQSSTPVSPTTSPNTPEDTVTPLTATSFDASTTPITITNVTPVTSTTSPQGIGIYVVPPQIREGSTPMPAVLHIDANGEVLLRGVVTQISTTTLTLTSWGGSWTVRIGTTTAFLPQSLAAVGGFSRITIGDFVGVLGTVSGTEESTLTTSNLRDWTLAPLR